MRQPPVSPDTDVPSLERALALLRFLDHPFRAQGASASQIYRGLKLPRASFYRLLKPLLDADLVIQEPRTGRYRLGTGLIELGYYAWRAAPLVYLARPILCALAEQTGQTVELLVPTGRWGMLWLDVWHGRLHLDRWDLRPGLYVPVNQRNAHGLCYLAFDGKRRPAEYLRLAGTPGGRKDLWLGSDEPVDWVPNRCAEVRRRGFADGVNRGKPETARVAAPVFTRANPRRVAATMGVYCLKEELTPGRTEEWGTLLQEKARELEARL